MVNHNIKVDVKASNIITNNVGYRLHTFNLEKNEPTCDVFILYCINDANDVYKTYIVPSCKFYGQTQVGVNLMNILTTGTYYINMMTFIKSY